MASVRVNDRVVAVGDEVQYIVGGRIKTHPATVIDIADGAAGKLNLRVNGRVIKSVSPGNQFGMWK